GLPLDGIDVRLLNDGRETAISHGYARLLRRFNLPHPRWVRDLRRLGAELIHVHFGTEAVEFWPNARQLSVPLLVTLHGYDITVHKEDWEHGSAGAVKALYPRRLLAMANEPRIHFIAVSEAIKQSAIEFGIPAQRIFVQYIGVDCDLFKPAG